MYTVVNTTMKKVGIIVKLTRSATPALPAMVIIPSAKARASVPASVERSPQLNTPLDSLGDMAFDNSDMFTPVLKTQFMSTNDCIGAPNPNQMEALIICKKERK